MFTADFLKKLCPPPSSASERKIYDSYIAALTSPEAETLLGKFGIVNDRRRAHAIAQWAHESGGFTVIWESGTYSADRIMAIFGVDKHSAKVTRAEANRLAGNGPALFERVYGLGNPTKVKDLGNTQSGDGWRFRGCGIVQVTGRAAHERYAQAIGCKLEDLALPINGLHAACLEWNEKRCNPLADSEDGTDRALRAITKRINGGYNGLADRKGYYRKAVRLMAASGAPVSRTPADRKPILEIGEDGDEVRLLQELLVKAGYVVPIDGIMGPKTESALAGFQANHGLLGTGRADDATWEMLKAVTAEGNRTRKTRSVDETKLKKESVVFKVLDRIAFYARWIYRLIFGGTAIGATAEASGIDVVDNVASGIERVGTISTKVGFPHALGTTSGRIIIGILVIGFLLFLFERWANRGKEARKDDAELNGNLAV